MSDEFKACPFCGENHQPVKVFEIFKYDSNGNGIPVNGRDAISVSCILPTNPFIDVSLWQSRPIEDAQAACIAELVKSNALLWDRCEVLEGAWNTRNEIAMKLEVAMAEKTWCQLCQCFHSSPCFHPGNALLIERDVRYAELKHANDVLAGAMDKADAQVVIVSRENAALREASDHVIAAWGTDEWIRADMQDAVDELEALIEPYLDPPQEIDTEEVPQQ